MLLSATLHISISKPLDVIHMHTFSAAKTLKFESFHNSLKKLYKWVYLTNKSHSFINIICILLYHSRFFPTTTAVAPHPKVKRLLLMAYKGRKFLSDKRT